MVLLRLHQYIDARCVNDPLENLSGGFTDTVGDGMCHAAVDSMYV